MANRLAWRSVGSLLTVVSLVVALSVSGLTGQVVPQPLGQPVGLPKDPNLDLAGVALPRNNRLESQIQAAQEYTQTKNWQEATSILQKLLELPEDVFVLRARTTADGKHAEVMVSIRQEANRMVAALPTAGKEFYQLNYGGLAAGFLKEAKEKGSPELLGKILRIYLHTQAGAEAALLLGTYQLDRGNYFAASLCFERLLERSGIESVSPVALARAALAFQLSGEPAQRDKVFAQLKQRGLREVSVIGNNPIALEDWRAQVSKMTRPTEAGVSDWALVGGSPKRTASASGGTAFLEPLWRKATTKETDSRALLTQVYSALIDRMMPLVPGMIPLAEKVIVAGKQMDLVVYRSHWGLHAVNLKTGEVEWESPNEWSVDGMSNPRRLDISRRKLAVTEWITTFQNMGSRAGVPLENTTVGTLASDGQRVYAINDLQVPPPMTNGGYGMPFDNSGGGGGFGRYGPELSEAIQSNRIRAYDLANGKLKWETGGKRDAGLFPEVQGATGVGEGAFEIDLSDSHFLGVPLPIGGRLYALNEKQQEIRLLTLDPESGRVISAQTLVTTRDRMVMDTLRRTMAAHLAYGDGILVCPTNAGAILGVDMLTGSLVWSYLYREVPEGTVEEGDGIGRPARRPRAQFVPGMGNAIASTTPNSYWRSAPPMIAGDRVVFTSPYAKSLICLDLRTGVKIWSHQRSDEDLYLGGVHLGKVMVVGKRSVRGIDLATGQTAWTAETGNPSGYGTASGNLFFVPLRESAKSRDPEICTIDITTGKVLAHTKSRKKEVPGNLVFHGGEVVSQGPLELCAFPQLAVKLAQIDEKIRLNPADPEGLADRGELRLDKGDFAGAITDLDQSLVNNPPAVVRAKASEKLYEAFAEAFQEDFGRWESKLGRFEEVCKVPGDSPETKAEERKRQAIFLGLLGRGREKQGRLLDAVKAYELLSAVVDAGMYFTPSDDTPLSISADALSRGRLLSMFSSAKPKERTELEAWLGARLLELKTTPVGDEKTRVQKLNNFALAFGGLFEAGRAASIELARPAAEAGSKVELVLAERLLAGAQGGTWPADQAALGLDLEAKIYASRQLVPDAAQVLTEAAKRYPDRMVRPGMTARRVLDELAADRRFLPYLAEPNAIAPNGPIKVIEERSNNVPRQTVLHPVIRQGPAPVWFDRHQFHLQNTNQSGNLTLKAFSQVTGETWDLALGGPSMHQNLMAGTNPGAKRQPFVYQTSGHLMILWIANMVHGIDPVGRKLLWEVNLVTGKSNPAIDGKTSASNPATKVRPIGSQPNFNSQLNFNQNSYMIDPVDGMLVQYREDGWKQRVGMAGPIVDGVIPLLGRDGLSGHDIVTGRMLWTRNDIRTDYLIVGQEGGIMFLVQTNTDGTPAGSKAVRALDGGLVTKADFSLAYKHRVLMSGSRILALLPQKNADKNPNSVATPPRLVVVDMNSGKEVLSRELALGTRAAITELGGFAGLIGLQGEVEIVSLPDGKTLHKVTVEPSHVEKTAIHLVADANRIYLIPNKPTEQLMGGVQSNFMGQLMLKLLPTNGEVYAFEQLTGKLAWRNTLVNQLMILDRFEELPMVLFTSRFNRLVNIQNARSVVATVGLKSYDKRTGKLIVDKDFGQQAQPFHGFVVDLRLGRLDLMDYQNRISFLWGPGLALGEGAKLASGPSVDSRPPSTNALNLDIAINGFPILLGGVQFNQVIRRGVPIPVQPVIKPEVFPPVPQKPNRIVVPPQKPPAEPKPNSR